MPDPARYQFDLPSTDRPEMVTLPERWYPGIQETWAGSTTSRIYHPIEGVRAVVVHATAGGSSAGAVSVMRRGVASFHWLVPDENEEQHGELVWACAPETLAAWHVRNSRSHPDVWGGKNRINHFSLGIEVVNNQREWDPFSDWQVEITARIVRYCWAKYPNLVHVVSHAKLDPERRSDPGELFPWQRFRELVLDGDDPPSEPLVACATHVSELDDVPTDGCCTG